MVHAGQVDEASKTVSGTSKRPQVSSLGYSSASKARKDLAGGDAGAKRRRAPGTGRPTRKPRRSERRYRARAACRLSLSPRWGSWAMSLPSGGSLGSASVTPGQLLPSRWDWRRPLARVGRGQTCSPSRTCATSPGSRFPPASRQAPADALPAGLYAASSPLKNGLRREGAAFC